MLADVRGTTLYHAGLGHGTPLVLLHGGMGFDHSYFRPWLDPLSDTVRLVYVDQRGHGHSSPVASFEGVELQSWVEDVEGLRHYLGLDQVVLLGHSAGGMVAQAYARLYPGRLLGLVLCDTVPCFDYADDFFAAFSAKADPSQLEAVRRLFTACPSDDDDFRSLVRAIFPLYLGAPAPELVEKLTAGIIFRAAAFRHFAATVLATFDSRPWLSSIKAPTLIIDGAKDIGFPPALSGKRLTALLPNATYACLEGCGHMPFAERPEKFRSVLRSFLKGLPGVTSSAESACSTALA